MPGTGSSAPRLGKRKRASQSVSAPSASHQGSHDSSSDPSADEQDVHDAFRRAFEKRFAPLPSAGIRTKPKLDSGRHVTQHPGSDMDELEDMRSDSEPDQSDEFAGLSDDDDAADSSSSDPASDEPSIQVVDATASHNPWSAPDARPSDAKSFMSSKPPSTLAANTRPKPQNTTPSTTNTSTTDDEDAAHKVNDLALHRLLTESHLLTPTNPSATLSHQPGTTPQSNPRSRRAAQLALRVSALGGAPAPPQRMPLSHARGIAARATAREAARRREAREAGVVLERPSSASGKKKSAERRERGVGAPSVGRFEGGGTLRLSGRDIRGLTSSRGERGGKRGGKKRGGRGAGLRF